MMQNSADQILAQAGSLKSSFQLRTVNGKTIPYQNEIPYPSFDPQSRMIKSLAGIWRKKRFEADHDWTMTLRDDYWITTTEKEALGITTTDFDDSSWENHSVPSPENKLTGKEEVNGAETFENGVWYRKKIVLDEKWGQKVITLKCLGLSYVGDFWINGSYLGYHEGGYTPVSFDVTSALTSGENVIVIRIDNPPWTTRNDTVPAVNNDFFNYTGLIQDLFIEATDSIHIVRTDVVPNNIQGDLDITVVLENRTNQSKSVFSRYGIYETDFTSENWLSSPHAKSICTQMISAEGLTEHTIEFLPHETRVISFKVSIDNPKLWSIRKPNLYVFEAVLFDKDIEIDAFHSQFGIRTVTTQKASICLNEKPIFFAGVARHEEWPDYGRTASWERIKNDFLKIDELSVNMVRTAHYPNHIYTYIMLDRLGLTAMNEIPIWQFDTNHYEIQEQREISYQMWREMIFSNFNRPSIIMWSTQNESKDVKLRKRYNERLVNEVRDLYNDNRLITQSAAADQPGFDDESMEPLDVAGWTMYFGIFHGSTPYEGTRDFIEKAHEKWPNKPIINTEYGIWSRGDDSSEQVQIEIYKDVQQALLEKATVTPEGFINNNGYVAGMDYWTAFDWYVNHNHFYQTMGMYHMDRETKKPLYHQFLEDHLRLMEKTNGIGGYTSNQLEENIIIQSQALSSGGTKISLQETSDMSKFNYLGIKVFDPKNSAGMTVDIADASGNITSYPTFEIQVNKEYEVFVPLWKLNQTILSEATSVTISYDDGRQLEIIELACMFAGR